MNAPLTNRQKTALARLAARAWNHLRALAIPLPPLDDWRHEETLKATAGLAGGLKQATQADYIPIYNHLSAYLGLPPRKDRTWSPQAKALWLLRDAMARYETTPAYLAHIVRDQLKLPCDGTTVYQTLKRHATPEHLRHLTWTIINRGRAEARKMEAQTGYKTTEPHAASWRT